MMLERVIAVVLALIVCVAAIEGGAITKKRSAEEYGEGFENGLARVSTIPTLYSLRTASHNFSMYFKKE